MMYLMLGTVATVVENDPGKGGISLWTWFWIGLGVVWLVKSWQVIGPAQVGILLVFGKPIPIAWGSGLIPCPWCPIRWSGLRIFEVARLPTKMFNLAYEGTDESNVWSLDHQLLRLQISVYLRLPFHDGRACVKILKSGVPLDEKKLKEWMEDEVMRVARKVMATRGYEVIISGSDSDQITAEANTAFSNSNGLLVRSGLYGTNVRDTSEGQGEVLMKIEQALLGSELQEDLARVESARVKVKAARSMAEVSAIEAGGAIDLLMAGWIQTEVDRQGCDVKTAKATAHANGTWDRQFQAYKDFLLANIGSLNINRIEIGSPDGKGISGDLSAAAAFASVLHGGGAGQGGRQPNQGGGSGTGPKPPKGQPSPAWLRRHGGGGSAP